MHNVHTFGSNHSGTYDCMHLKQTQFNYCNKTTILQMVLAIYIRVERIPVLVNSSLKY